MGEEAVVADLAEPDEQAPQDEAGTDDEGEVEAGTGRRRSRPRLRRTVGRRGFELPGLGAGSRGGHAAERYDGVPAGQRTPVRTPR